MTALTNLQDNLDKVAYNTVFDTDKIVKTFNGSFNYTTQTITRAYTFGGLPNNVKVFRIEHGFTRPVFVEMFWSIDNSTYGLGGAGSTAGYYTIGYSDSTYCYVMPTALPANTIVYYKIVCNWISNYDTTNPTVGPYAELPASYTQTLRSENVTGSIIQQDAVSISTSSAFLVDAVGTIGHSVTYAPNMKVFFEAFSGEVWPLNYGGISNPYLVDDNQVEAQAFVSTSALTINALMKAANGSRRFWYILYAKKGTARTATYGSAQSAI